MGLHKLHSTYTTNRLGITLAELMVAATLIISGLAVIGKLTVATGRIWQQARHHRVAIEELSNQLERLTALSPQQRAAEIDQLIPSSHAAELLPAATLSAQSVDDSDGRRLELSIDWDRGTPAEPLKLVAWIDSFDNELVEPAEAQESSL